MLWGVWLTTSLYYVVPCSFACQLDHAWPVPSIVCQSMQGVWSGTGVDLWLGQPVACCRHELPFPGPGTITSLSLSLSLSLCVCVCVCVCVCGVLAGISIFMAMNIVCCWNPQVKGMKWSIKAWPMGRSHLISPSRSSHQYHKIFWKLAGLPLGGTPLGLVLWEGSPRQAADLIKWTKIVCVCARVCLAVSVHIHCTIVEPYSTVLCFIIVCYYTECILHVHT